MTCRWMLGLAAVGAALLAQPRGTAQDATLSADWPEWRGPDRNGVAPSSPPLAPVWPQQGPRRLWANHDLPLKPHQYAGGHSCPAVAGGRVYLYLHDIGVPRDTIACLDLATGKRIWRKDFPGQATWHGGSGTPCVVGDRVYVAAARTAYCLRTENGQVVWQRPLDAPPQEGQEISSSFGVLAQRAIVMAGPVLGLSLVDGHTMWEAPTTGGYSSVMTSVVPWPHEGRTYGIYAGVDRLACVNPSDGKLVWEVAGEQVWGGTAPSPVVTGDDLAVYFNGRMNAYHLTLQGPQQLWTAPFFEEYSSPIVWRDRVYTVGPNEQGGRPTVRCRELLTGKVLWDVPVSTPEYSSPVLADGKLFVLTDHGSLLRMIHPLTGRMLGVGFVGAQVWSSPAVADGKLLVRIPDGVACYDLTTAGNPLEPPASREDHYLELVEATKNVCGWGAARDRATIVGEPLSIGKRAFRRGIGTHAPAELIFPLSGQDRWLTFYEGVAGYLTDAGSVTVEVWLDGVKVHQSPVLRAGDEPVYVSLPLQGARELRIVGTDGGDGNGWDHLNLCNLRVSKRLTTPPPDLR